MHYNTFFNFFQLIDKDFLCKIDTVLQKTAKPLLWLTTAFLYAPACSRNIKHRAIIFIHNFLLFNWVSLKIYSPLQIFTQVQRIGLKILSEERIQIQFKLVSNFLVRSANLRNSTSMSSMLCVPWVGTYMFVVTFCPSNIECNRGLRSMVFYDELVIL